MITVEDFNSVLKEYGGANIYHCIDTSLISEDYDFDGIKYDFCEVDRETTDTDEYTFKFKVVNGAWTGGYYILDSDDEYVDDATTSYNSSTGVITIVTDNPTIKLYLYLCNIAWEFEFQKMYWKIRNPYTIKIIAQEFQREDDLVSIYFDLLHENGIVDAVYVKPWGQSRSEKKLPFENIFYTCNYCAPIACFTSTDVKYLDSVFRFRLGNNKLYLPYEKFYNDPLMFKIIPSTTNIGKINKMSITVDNVLAGFEVYYNNTKTIATQRSPTYPDNNIWDFDLDLMDKTDLSPVKLKIKSTSENYLYYHDYDYVLNCSYLVINNVSDLVTECATGGASIFKLGTDLILTSDLPIAHDLTILGEEHSIDLNGHSIIVSDGIKFSMENCELSNGDNAIVQQVNSELNLDRVTFANCESSEYSNLGSCIYCDVDLDSLSVEDDFKTVLTNCEFYDNHNAIFHGGNLIINGCKLHNIDLDYLDKHNVAFLYQSDGTASIKNSILDIDYTDTDLCTNEESIGFAQCLIKCGETAKINNQSYTDLRDIGLDLSSNACHIFAKYYYSILEECVFTSPILDKEDKAYCYALTGMNKVFKENVQITKASDNAENTYRKIEW